MMQLGSSMISVTKHGAAPMRSPLASTMNMGFDEDLLSQQ